MTPFPKVSWKKLLLCLLISVFLLQIYVAIIAHQSISNISHVQTNQNHEHEIVANIDLYPQQVLAEPIAQSKHDTNKFISIKHEQDTHPLKERRRHIAKHHDRHSKRIREMRYRSLRFNHMLSNGSNMKRHFSRFGAKMNVDDDSNMNPEMFPLFQELQELESEKQDGGWLDIERISKDSALYTIREKNLNISQILANNETVNKMVKYNFKTESIINTRWNKQQIDQLLNDKHKLYTKYHILPYESRMNYNLQQLEYEILEWIIKHQHPEQCPYAYVELQVSDRCGFGCKLDDHILIFAKFALQTGLLFEFVDWGQNVSTTLHEYGAWNAFFRPVSNILEICNEEELLILRANGLKRKPMEIGYWLPDIFKERIERLHADPVLYFHGVINRYLLRLNAKYRTQYMDLRDELWDTMKSDIESEPIWIGCHVRRTDKIMESNVYAWSNYMDLIQYMLQYNEVKNDGNHVLLATDDVNIVQNAIMVNNKHSNAFDVLWNKYSIDIDKYGAVDLKQRRTEHALRSIVFDILLLADCDLFVGQDGSRVSRLVLELIAMRLPDYKQRVISLDAVNKNVLDFPYWISAVWIYSKEEMVMKMAHGARNRVKRPRRKISK